MDVQMQARELFRARNVAVKSLESYVVFSYEYVLRSVKAEAQTNLVKQLLDWGKMLSDDAAYNDIGKIERKFEEYLFQESIEMDIEMNWDDYLQRTHYITGKLLAGRTIRSEEIEWLKGTFFDDFPEYLFLKNYEEDYGDFFKINSLAQKMKMADLYYLYIEGKGV